MRQDSFCLMPRYPDTPFLKLALKRKKRALADCIFVALKNGSAEAMLERYGG